MSDVLFTFQVPEVSDAQLARALHWGAVDEGTNLSDLLVELGARQIVALDKGCYLVLTSQGVVCSVDSSRVGMDATFTVSPFLDF